MRPVIRCLCCLIVISALTAACSNQPPPPDLSSPTLPAPTLSSSASTSSAPTSSASPEASTASPDETSGRLLNVPVPDSAYETAAALLAAERPPHDRIRLAQQINGITPALLTPEARPAQFNVGDQTEFFFNADLEGDYQAIPAELRLLSDNVAWWVSLTAAVEEAALQAAAERFESEILPINRLIFGQEPSPGIDGIPAFNILLIQQPEWGGFFGYFSNLNQFPSAIFPYSNERELLIINIERADLSSLSFAAQLGHEYQHLIQWNLDTNEDSWLNEALSELAIFLSGSTYVDGEARANSNSEIFANMPHIQLTSRPEESGGVDDLSVFAHYGAERPFIIYLLEQFGPEFIRAVANNPAPGVVSIQQELDKLDGSPRFQDVYANWLIANLLDQPQLAEGQFGYEEYESLLPLRRVVESFSPEPGIGHLPPYGAHYYELKSTEDVTVSFTGSTLARLTPMDPASGDYAWYSNRGDESSFSLTRSFDLSDLQSATLNYKVWYELEEFYDFAYLQISADGGNSWTILETAAGTEEDPQDTAYGWGYTGVATQWITESIDLTEYAGQVVDIRFEVLTDFSTNRDGLLLDDIEIPELGYFDGAEDDAGGWEAVGFVRSSNFVPAEWIVWLVELTEPTSVTRLELDSQQATEFTISGFGERFPFAAVVISPTAPVTTMELDYELILQTR